jgi:hypothetical protein
LPDIAVPYKSTTKGYVKPMAIVDATLSINHHPLTRNLFEEIHVTIAGVIKSRIIHSYIVVFVTIAGVIKSRIIHSYILLGLCLVPLWYSWKERLLGFSPSATSLLGGEDFAPFCLLWHSMIGNRGGCWGATHFEFAWPVVGQRKNAEPAQSLRSS